MVRKTLIKKFNLDVTSGDTPANIKNDRPGKAVVCALLVTVLIAFVQHPDLSSYYVPSSLSIRGIMIGGNGRSLEAVTTATVEPVGPAVNIDPSTSSSASTSSSSSSLPTCRALMQSPNSAYRDGSFLTRHTIPISWSPRADGSRELHHSMCQLHRYTGEEARQCLAGQHVNMIGDSLTRYMYLSLAWFIHKSQYPPRFGTTNNCQHIDEQGQPACSPPNEPNICMEGDWRGIDSWTTYTRAIGSYLFDGSMETDGVRSAKTDVHQAVGNYLYVSPPAITTTPEQKRIILSMQNEFGSAPLHGFHLTGCAYNGTCTYPEDLLERRMERALNLSFDFSETLDQALNVTHGSLSQFYPPVDIALYNRGIWGAMSKEWSELIMPLLYQYTQGPSGRCFYRASTRSIQEDRTNARPTALKLGCGYLDFTHLLDDFLQLPYSHPFPPENAGGHSMREWMDVYWDEVHFMPWVYEELNNMLLNVICNSKILDSQEKTQ